ncbi:MAG: protein kinase [bacterium]
MEELPTELRDALADRYLLEARAGSGGMAYVYRARDVRHNRNVAIKVLRPYLSTSLGPERFKREIDIAARLQHPNILPVFDSGEAAGALYYVMPFIEGGSLRSRLTERDTLPIDEATRITCEVGDALAWAHRSGVMHRDIKPENILFSAGHALVADFGIARALVEQGESSERMTQPGFGLGTPEYMSPEQAFGESNVDGRTDLYALACMFYEMLTGSPPFSGPATALLLQKTTRNAPRPRAPLPLAAHVEHTLLRALSRDPDDRYATVEDFIKALSSPTGSYPVVPRPGPPQARSIAVLPFTNTGGDAQDEYFTEGLTEELIHALGATKGLRVLGRMTSFALRNRTLESLRKDGDLNVDTLLQGSVRRGGERLRILAHLVDTRTGFEIWSERYDRMLTDVFEIQDDITRAIVDALRVELLAKPPAEAMHDVGAYERYLEARYHWNRRTVTGMQRSVKALHEALAIDASFVAALAALAETHVTLALYGGEPPEPAMRAARDAAKRALELQPELGEALSALACVRAFWDWDWKGAAADFRRAIDASPQYPIAHQWYAMHALVPRGQFPLAQRELLRAKELDPLSPAIAVSIGLTNFFARDFDTAAETFETLLLRDADFAPAHAFLGQVQAEQGKFFESIRHLQRALDLGSDSPEFIAAMGVSYARSGDMHSAQRVLDRLAEGGKSGYVSPVLFAQVHAAMGNSGAALDALDAARELRATDLAWIGVRPVFDALRTEPRFTELLDSIGLP